MILKTGETAVFEFWFENTSGEGVAGLTVTADVYNPAGTKVVTNGAATEIGGGLYRYNHTASSAGAWNAIGKTTSSSVVARHRPSVQFAGVAGVDYLDAAISSIATAITGLAAAVWAYATRTLTMSQAQIMDTLHGPTISVRRGDKTTIDITDLGSLANRSHLYFTAKQSVRQSDAQAYIQIEETDGLLIIMGAAATASDGSLTVLDEVVGNIRIVLNGAAAALLDPTAAGVYDIQVHDADGEPHSTEALPFAVTGDVTRATA